MRGVKLVSIEAICPECNQPFKAHKSNTVYCSRQCYHKVWRTKNKYEQAEKIIARATAKKYALTQSPLYAPRS